MAQKKLNTIQIILMAHYKNLLIQIILMAHVCENDMIQLKDIFQIVAAWLQFSTDEYSVHYVATACRPVTCVGHPNDNLHNSTLSVHSALFPCHILSLGQVGIL